MAWITIGQATKRFGEGLRYKFLARLARTGKLTATEIDGRLFIDDASLAELIAQGRIDALQPRVKPLPGQSPSRRGRRSA